MSQDAEAEKRAHAAARASLEDSNARTHKLEVETFERMNFPSNMGWLPVDISEAEPSYYLIERDGQLIRLIEDTDRPWPMQARLALPHPKPGEQA